MESEALILRQAREAVAEVERLRGYLERIAGMCDVSAHCPCGRPNGIPGVRSCALRGLNTTEAAEPTNG